ncbi:transcriptional regulatory protein LGE1 [Drosophila serrata]|uniref:transcriptional regulatory protein LGE1 n=1 Tax=Drosophila serrata TaxID=7274 RepID=UPI000A1D1A37|nr:transcriptional regulatory protein LGE1 [Drosophila serrata]
MLSLRPSFVTLLMGFLCIVQGARIVRDTADIPTELFKPVGKKAGNERTRSNRGNSTGELYPGSEESDVRFQERFEGGVEVVTEENDLEEENDYDTQPLYRQGPRRTSGFPSPNYENSFPQGVPRFGRPEISRPPFPSSSSFRNSNIIPLIFNPNESNQNTSSWVSRPMQVPLSANNFGRPLSSGRSGPFGSSNNFHRSESYSYSSDGRGPPQIEHNVYDSRDPYRQVSLRNF